MAKSRKDINRARIYEILREMAGKNTTPQIRDRLVGENLISPLDFDAYSLDETRDWIEEFSRKSVKEGDTDQEFLNLKEVLEDGTVQSYYKKPQETTRNEALQTLENQKKIRGREDKKLIRLYKKMCTIHGKRWIDRHFTLNDEKVGV